MRDPDRFGLDRPGPRRIRFFAFLSKLFGGFGDKERGREFRYKR